jgi:isopenicillin N synthase-like dioxygenase
MQGTAEDHCTVRCDVLCDSAHPERLEEAERLCAALRRNGHVFLDGATMLPPQLLRRTFELCRRAHALPRAERQRFAGGLERTRLTYSATEEAYEVGTQASAESWNFSRSREWSAGEQQGVSPEGLEELDEFIDDLYSRQDQLALGLLAAMSDSLGLPTQTFGKHLHQGDLGTVRLLKYPPRPSKDMRSVGISAHTDFELITLMAQDEAGLQFMFPPAGGSTHAGEWVELPVREGQCIVIVNDMMERFTNGVHDTALLWLCRTRSCDCGGCVDILQACSLRRHTGFEHRRRCGIPSFALSRCIQTHRCTRCRLSCLRSIQLHTPVLQWLSIWSRPCERFVRERAPGTRSKGARCRRHGSTALLVCSKTMIVDSTRPSVVHFSQPLKTC